MVIGYNPSHSNINSEVNAPFKILSTLLRFLHSDTEQKEEDSLANRKIGQGERLDTCEGYNDLYDEEDEGSNFDDSFKYGESDDGQDKPADNELEVNMDELQDGDQADLLQMEEKKQGETGGSSAEKDLETCSDTGSTLSAVNFRKNLFAVKESKDKGLADMETGSEVYMSELLAGFDMEDFDEAEEQNEEDLIMLDDPFAKVEDLKKELLHMFE